MQDAQADKIIRRINQDMRQAMKDKNRVKLSALKSLLARISNAEAVPCDHTYNEEPGGGTRQGVGSTEVGRRQLFSDDIQRIIADEISEIEGALKDLKPDDTYAIELHEKLKAAREYFGC